MVRPGSRAADIGCDHGKLAASLILSGRCREVIAADIAPGPLAGAQRLFEELGICGSARTLLCDGLDGIGPESADDVIIAGLGADEIERIIARAPWLRDPEKQLVLVPASRHGSLRRFLAREGFQRTAELAVLEAGQLYTVIAARWLDLPRELDLREAELGSIPPCGDGKAYWLRVRSRCLRIADGQLASERPDRNTICEREALAEHIATELE